MHFAVLMRMIDETGSRARIPDRRGHGPDGRAKAQGHRMKKRRRRSGQG
jgi:hypothetical protein